MKDRREGELREPNPVPESATLSAIRDLKSAAVEISEATLTPAVRQALMELRNHKEFMLLVEIIRPKGGK